LAAHNTPHDTTERFAVAEFSVRAHGAAGDGKTLDTAAIQAAVDACADAGGGRVIVPAGGVYLSATITLRDHVELHVERGATIAASGRWADYATGPRVSGLSGGIIDAESGQGRALISATGARDIAVTGGGVIDGGGRHFARRDLGEIYEMASQRPFTLFFLHCANVTIRDAEFIDAAYWTVRLSVCEDIVIDGVRIHNDPKLPNNDGIDLDWCQRARISNCDIDTGDDGISLKACEEFAGNTACQDIVIANCTIKSRSSALVIGADITGPIRRVVFSGCIVRQSHRGLSVNLAQRGGPVESILFCDCIIETQYDDDAWWGNGEPIYVSAEPWHGGEVGTIAHVWFRNVQCRSENGVVIQAVRPGLVQDVRMDDVRVELGSWTGRKGGRIDLRPTSRDEFRDHPTTGFYLENAAAIKLTGCEVAWQGKTQPCWGLALESHGPDAPQIERFAGAASAAGAAGHQAWPATP